MRDSGVGVEVHDRPGDEPVVRTPEILTGRATMIDGVKFIGEAGSGHAIVMDGPEEYGGTNRAMRPIELFVVGLGGCTAVDVVRLLREMREEVSDCVVDVRVERAIGAPMVFTRIHIHYALSGTRLNPIKVRSAIKVSRDRFCSASAMLGHTAEITYDFEIRPRE